MIKKIIKNFEFERVCNTMEFLNWTWHYNKKSPTTEELIAYAKDMMKDVIKRSNKQQKNIKNYCGGFECFAQFNKAKGCCDFVELRFVLTSWDEYKK